MPIYGFSAVGCVQGKGMLLWRREVAHLVDDEEGQVRDVLCTHEMSSGGGPHVT